jgi:ABC-2 type transport system permease protein
MRKILFIIVKELIQLRRDRMMFPLLFIAPILQLIILGYVANIDVKNVKIGIFDFDSSFMSRELVRDFTSSEYFIEKSYSRDFKEIDELIEKGEVSMALIIPKGFERRLSSGNPVNVQIIIDGTDATVATIAMNYSSQILTKFYIRSFSKFFPSKFNGIRLESRVLYNPELKGSHFMVPAVITLLLTLIIGVLSSMAIVRERENGTLEQLIVTPIKPQHFILGKIAPFVLIGYLDITIIIIVAIYWFKVPVKGSIPLLYLFSGFYILYTVGIGIFLSTISKTQQQAMITAMFFIFLPSILLSGFIFPVENMPRIIKFFTNFVPLKFFLEIVRGIFLKGSGFKELYDEAFFIFLWGIAVLSFSLLRFRKKL